MRRRVREGGRRAAEGKGGRRRVRVHRGCIEGSRGRCGGAVRRGGAGSTACAAARKRRRSGSL